MIIWWSLQSVKPCRRRRPCVVLSGGRKGHGGWGRHRLLQYIIIFDISYIILYRILYIYNILYKISTYIWAMRKLPPARISISSFSAEFSTLVNICRFIIFSPCHRVGGCRTHPPAPHPRQPLNKFSWIYLNHRETLDDQRHRPYHREAPRPAFVLFEASEVLDLESRLRLAGGPD